jgi:hypothetical protein
MNSQVPRSFILMLGTYLPQNPTFGNVNWATVAIEELASLAGIPVAEFEANCLEVLNDSVVPPAGDVAGVAGQVLPVDGTAG